MKPWQMPVPGEERMMADVLPHAERYGRSIVPPHVWPDLEDWLATDTLKAVRTWARLEQQDVPLKAFVLRCVRNRAMKVLDRLRTVHDFAPVITAQHVYAHERAQSWQTIVLTAQAARLMEASTEDEIPGALWAVMDLGMTFEEYDEAFGELVEIAKSASGCICMVSLRIQAGIESFNGKTRTVRFTPLDRTVQVDPLIALVLMQVHGAGDARDIQPGDGEVDIPLRNVPESILSRLGLPKVDLPGEENLFVRIRQVAS